jgi:RHS repeat-associated protein
LATKNYPNTVKATYLYDQNGSISRITYKKGTAALTRYDYLRDNVGNITEEEETKANGTQLWNNYTYDDADQLVLNDAPTDTYTYTYDDVGNISTASNGNTGTSVYSYNDANQLTAKTNTTRNFTYDNQGNQITDTGKVLAYNYDNQMKTYTSGSLTTSYIYDAVGNRIDKTQTGTGAVNYQYVNTGNNNVLVAKNLTASTSNFYVYGLDLISQGAAGTSNRQYYLTDAMGNVRYVTNSTGSTVTNGTLAYDPYGKQTGGSTTLTNYAFQAEQKDTESGLTYLRARYYDSTSGRFTSQDPVPGALSMPGTQNGYNYVNNNPTNLSDPSGEFPTVVIGAIIGSVAGAVTNGITYAFTTHNFNLRDLGANVAGGAVSGGISGACLGSGVGLLLGTGCGGASGLLGDFVTQRLDTQEGVDLGHVGVAAAAGALGGALGNVGAANINKGWLALANRNPGGLSASNILPWATTGSLGQKLQLNNLVGNIWGLGINLIEESTYSNNCNWGSL